MDMTNAQLVSELEEMRQRVAELKESESKLRSVMKSIPDFVFVFDEEGRFTSFHVDVEETYVPQEVFIGKLPSQVMPQNVSLLMDQAFARNKNGEIAEFEYHLEIGGATKWYSAKLSPVIMDGRFSGSIAVCRNITEHIKADDRVRESEERYRTLFESAAEGILIADIETKKFLHANPAICTMLGYSNEELRKIGVPDIHPKDQLEEIISKFEAYTRGEKQLTTVPCLKKDGSIIYTDINAARAVIDGRSCNIGFFTDVTERNLIMNALKEVNHDLKVAQRLTKIGNWKWIIADNKVTWSEELCHINGWDPLLPVPTFAEMVKFYTSESWERLSELVTKAINTGEPYEIEADQMRTDGTMIKTFCRGEVDYDAGGNIISLHGTVQDITERKRTQEELESLVQTVTKTAREWQETFDAVTDFVTLISPQHEFLRINRSTAEALGKKPEEVIGKKCYELVHGLDHPILGCPCTEALKTQNPSSTEVEDHGRIYITTASPITDKDGKVTAFVHTVKDITERKLMEEEHQRTTKLESIGTLAGGIAHDFNNILTGILGNIQLADGYLKQNKADTAKVMLAEAEKASLRAKDLTQQLLTFSKGGAPVKKVMHVNRLIKETVTFILRGSRNKPEFALVEDLWAADVDEGQLNQVISNLIINADQAMPNGGIINVSASNSVIKNNSALPLPDGNYIEIAIKDRGVGIPLSHFDKIFDPYFTTKQRGNGLGLATAFSIIKNHGGYITFESELGAGTTFRFYLPATTSGVNKEREESSTQPLPQTHGKILVMDDEDSIRVLLEVILKNAGYEVELTRDGREAVHKYTEVKKSGKPFDAVILDLTIPGGMGGKEALAKLLEIDPGVKAIVSSGYSNDPIMADYRKLGFSAVIGKPYRITDVEEILSRLLTAKS